jgi:hypothetical protein
MRNLFSDGGDDDEDPHMWRIRVLLLAIAATIGTSSGISNAYGHADQDTRWSKDAS